MSPPVFRTLNVLSMNGNANFYHQIRYLIADDDLSRALAQLHDLLQNSPKLDEVLLQSARLNDISRQVRLGLTDFSQASLTKNQIRAGLLELLTEIESREQSLPEVRGEIEKFTAGKTFVQHAEKIYNIEKIDKADFS